MEELLRKYRFDTFVPDGQPAEVQLSVLDHADIVISAHGSAMTNLIFCNRSKILIEGCSKLTPASSFFVDFLGIRHYWTQMIRHFSFGQDNAYEWNVAEVASILRSVFGR